jgi:hypothetical protein
VAVWASGVEKLAALVHNDACVLKFVVISLLDEDLGLLKDFHRAGGSGTGMSTVEKRLIITGEFWD